MNRFVRSAILPLLVLFLTLSGGWGHAAPPQKSYRKSVETYQTPDVTLVDQNGKRVKLRQVVEGGKPVIVQFVFATCTTICPVLSAGFANLQKKLGENASKVHLVSVTIDPENDGPKQLREYLKRYRAREGWDFYTGSRSDIDLVMKSYDAYIQNKMNHYALTLIHLPGSNRWIRLQGIMSTSEFIEEVKAAGVAL